MGVMLENSNSIIVHDESG